MFMHVSGAMEYRRLGVPMGAAAPAGTDPHESGEFAQKVADASKVRAIAARAERAGARAAAVSMLAMRVRTSGALPEDFPPDLAELIGAYAFEGVVFSAVLSFETSPNLWPLQMRAFLSGAAQPPVKASPAEKSSMSTRK